MAILNMNDKLLDYIEEHPVYTFVIVLVAGILIFCGALKFL